MAWIWLVFTACYISEVKSIALPAYVIRTHRTDLRNLNVVEDISSNANRYEIVPSTEKQRAVQLPILTLVEYVLRFIKAIRNLRSLFLPFVRWALNGAQVLLGIAMTVGICTFTTDCTITFENSFARRPAMPYLDDIMNIFSVAYDKFNSLQN